VVVLTQSLARAEVRATEYIEPQAEGTKKGWRWQRTWTGLYSIIIEDSVVHDVWKKANA
jgi:hypothetical protein